MTRHGRSAAEIAADEEIERVATLVGQGEFDLLACRAGDSGSRGLTPRLRARRAREHVERLRRELRALENALDTLDPPAGPEDGGERVLVHVDLPPAVVQTMRRQGHMLVGGPVTLYPAEDVRGREAGMRSSPERSVQGRSP